MSYLVALLLLIAVACSPSQARTAVKEPAEVVTNQCRINLPSQVHTKLPLVLDGSSGSGFIYPTASDPANLVLKSGESIGLFCPGQPDSKSHGVTRSNSLTEGDEELDGPEVELVCKSGTSFTLGKESVEFDEFNCKEDNGPVLREAESDGSVCNNGKLYETGYYLDEDNFVRTIEICHNVETADALWAHAVIQPANSEATHYKGVKNSFKTGVLFNRLKVDDAYSLKGAYSTFQQLLGASVDDYLSTTPGDRKFLAKGHLIAKTDMFYKSEQESTMFYANVHPMWQQINSNGNWFAVEEYVRHLANSKKRPLDVWVGGLGVLELEGKKMYMKGKTPKVPVHAVSFKAVVDKPMKQAIVFVVVNNPYADDDEIKKKDYNVCTKLDICKNYFNNWDDTTKGYLYCCELPDFYKRNKDALGLEQFENFKIFKKLELP